jgi:hypothetical protein
MLRPGRHLPTAAALAAATLIVAVTVAPVDLAMPIVADSVAIFESIGSMAVGAMTVGATAACHAHEGRKRTERRQPQKCIHLLILLEIDTSRDNNTPCGQVATRDILASGDPRRTPADAAPPAADDAGAPRHAQPARRPSPRAAAPAF